MEACSPFFCTDHAEPLEIVAGDTVTFTRKGGNFKASDGWTLKYFVQNGSQSYSFAATTNGDDFPVTIVASASASWEPGRYELIALFKNSNSGRRTSVPVGVVTIAENPEKPFVSHAAKMVANLRAKLEARALPFADVETSNINGQSLTMMSAKQIRELLTFYEAKLISETRARRGCAGATVVQQVF